MSQLRGTDAAGGSMPLNVYQARVRSHQTDLNGAMYHGAYLDVFDDARIETFRRIGYTYARSRDGGWFPVIRRLDCEFYNAARMDELLSIHVHVEKMSTATLTIRYTCYRDGTKLAVAHVVFAFLDARGKPLRLPSDLRLVVKEHAELLVPVT
jgi:acyl-CoA thioester hydrolase